MAVKLLIDSASDISKSQAEKMGITMLPMVINFGTEEFFDGVDLLPIDFYKKLTSDKNHPKTSQISPYRFEEIFRELTKNGDEVVVICLSSKLSGTFEGAKRTAEEQFKNKVFVVDSLSATVGERLLCDFALELINKGMSAKEIAEQLDNAKTKLCVIGVLDTLEYLKRGGRISSAVAAIGGMLKVKPVVCIKEGEVKLVAKALGYKRGQTALIEYAIEQGEVNFEMPYCALWSGTDDCRVIEFKKECTKIYGEEKQIAHHVVGSTIGTHIGPNVVGVAYFKK